jgi:hypothetical protein
MSATNVSFAGRRESSGEERRFGHMRRAEILARVKALVVGNGFFAGGYGLRTGLKSWPSKETRGGRWTAFGLEAMGCGGLHCSICVWRNWFLRRSCDFPLEPDGTCGSGRDGKPPMR